MLSTGAKRLGGTGATGVFLSASVALVLYSDVGCGAETGQPQPSSYAMDSIPENYLRLYQEAGESRGLPWTVLAGIGQEESHHGRWDGPGITSGHNDWGAAGPMQFGALDGSAAGNSWGGRPVMEVEDRPSNGFGVDGNGDGVVDVYDPEDAIPAAADYLLAHGAPDNLEDAIFAYNRAWWYVDDVLSNAERYADGNFDVTKSQPSPAECEGALGDLVGQAPDELTARVVEWALGQRGKPYEYGGTGPDSFDCSGLLMRAYELGAGVSIPRISQDQWAFGPEIPQGEEQPGDLVFFDVARSGEPPGPGHVGMVVGDGLMVEAWCTNCGPIATREYDDPNRADIVGFTRPLEHPDVKAALGPSDS